MSWKIWKTSIQRANDEFKIAQDQGLKKHNWIRARDHFATANKLYVESRNLNEANIALALINFSKAMIDPANEDVWINTSTALKALGSTQIQILGLVSSYLFSAECSPQKCRA